jgi:hypothetical protein
VDRYSRSSPHGGNPDARDRDPLKAISDVLRYCSLDTTAIYTKVDLPNLARVALPWPEQQS